MREGPLCDRRTQTPHVRPSHANPARLTRHYGLATTLNMIRKVPSRRGSSAASFMHESSAAGRMRVLAHSRRPKDEGSTSGRRYSAYMSASVSPVERETWATPAAKAEATETP